MMKGTAERGIAQPGEAPRYGNRGTGFSFELVNAEDCDALQSAECSGRFLEVDVATLATMTKPTLLIAATGSLGPFREMTDQMALALPDSRKVLVPGDHMVDPTESSVLSFVQDVLG